MQVRSDSSSSGSSSVLPAFSSRVMVMMMLIRNGGCFTVTTSPCLASSRLVSPRFASPCPACPYGRRACPCFPSRAQSLNSEFSRNRVKALHRATVTLVIVLTSRSTFGGTQVLVAVPPDQSPLTEVGCLRCAHPHSPRQSQTLTAAAVPFIRLRAASIARYPVPAPYSLFLHSGPPRPLSCRAAPEVGSFQFALGGSGLPPCKLGRFTTAPREKTASFVARAPVF